MAGRGPDEHELHPAQRHAHRLAYSNPCVGGRRNSLREIDANRRSECTARVSTPVWKQYLGLKAIHPDALLFFRLGDFYELFDEDAQVASRELQLTLTARDFARGERTPM